MEAKKAEMDEAINNDTFTEWIRYGSDNNNNANRNVYFYYRLNNQAPLMVIDSQSNQYFMPQAQDPSMFTYAPVSGDYYTKPPGPPWYNTVEGVFGIVGIGVTIAGAAAFFYVRRLKEKKN